MLEEVNAVVKPVEGCQEHGRSGRVVTSPQNLDQRIESEEIEFREHAVGESKSKEKPPSNCDVQARYSFEGRGPTPRTPPRKKRERADR